jgi:hypothetical protein
VTRDDGGPAFPNPYIEADPLEKGMSLLDWFAAQALIGLCQADLRDEEYWVSPDLLARTAYSMGRAMLLARVSPPANSE